MGVGSTRPDLAWGRVKPDPAPDTRVGPEIFDVPTRPDPTRPGTRLARPSRVGSGHLIMPNCYYLGHCSSSVLVRGGACVNTYDGMKVNNGKRNVIKNVAMKGTRGSLGWTSCFTVTVNNCLKDPGNYWEAMRVKYHNSARINHLWPWMKDVCKETSANGGVSCNPPGQPGADVTGACSGLGSDNLIDVVAVNTTNYGLDWKHCENFTVTEKLNREINISLSQPLAAGFRDYIGNDLGLENTSANLKLRPDYLSCPLGLAGPRKFSEKSFYEGYNIPMPRGFRKVVTMDIKHIINQDLIIPSVRAQMMAAGDGEYSWLASSRGLSTKI